jgi:hypothetical protein
MPSLITRGYGGTSGGAFTGLSLTAYTNELIINCSADVGSLTGLASDPTSYIIELVSAGASVHATAVSASGSQIVLETTAATSGANYILHVPVLGILSVGGDVYAGPYSFSYSPSAGSPVTVQLVRSVDARTIEVVFSRRVNQADASNVANYSVSPTLTVLSATKITDLNYRLTTSQQVLDQNYNVTISNIQGA